MEDKVIKQYLIPDQTAKLIELGFGNPKSSVECELPKGDWRIGAVGIRKAYSIGELIEMLPMEDRAGERSMVYEGLEWLVNWDNDDGAINQVVAAELIDALYDMVVKLKEEGVI